MQVPGHPEGSTKWNPQKGPPMRGLIGRFDFVDPLGGLGWSLGQILGMLQPKVEGLGPSTLNPKLGIRI